MRPTLLCFPYSFPGGCIDPKLKSIPLVKIISRRLKRISEAANKCVLRGYPSKATIMGASECLAISNIFSSHCTLDFVWVFHTKDTFG